MYANWYKSNARARRLHSSFLIPNSSFLTPHFIRWRYNR